jgi:hypothetical protein
MLIPKIVSKDHVAENWLGCAAHGWEESKSFRSKSGSLAMFAAMRLASSFVSNFAAALRSGSFE